MKKKRMLALLCALSMVATCMVGCGEKDEPSNKSSEVQSSEKSEVPGNEDNSGSEDTESGEIMGEGQTITIASQLFFTVTDLNDNDFTRYIEERFNVNIEFQTLVDVAESIPLMVADNELPDMVLTNTNIGTGLVNAWGQEGFVLPLNDYLADPELASNWINNVTEGDKEIILNSISDINGTVYGLAGLDSGNIWDNAQWRIHLNTTWLDNLGLQMPTTTDELYTVLKAFKEQDPNGNGKQDEIPVYGSTAVWGGDITTALMNSFVYYHPWSEAGFTLSEDGTTVIAPYVTDAWREGLAYMRKLCEEGLMPSNVFTDDPVQFRAILDGEEDIVGLTSFGSNGNFATYSEPESNYNNLTMVAPFYGPDGVSYSPYMQPSPGIGGFISNDTEYPELCFKILETICYETDTALSMVFGKKDYNWTSDPEIAKNYASALVEGRGLENCTVIVTPYEGEYVLSVPTTAAWGMNALAYYPTVGVQIDPTGSAAKDHAYENQVVFYSEYSGRQPEYLLPSLEHTEEDQEKADMVYGDVTSTRDSFYAQVITGQVELNDDTWNAYLEELEACGLQTLLDVVQRSYDRTRN